MKCMIIGSVLVLGAMLNAANADTWVFRDTLRPNGHDRSMTAKRADGRKCGAAPGGRWFDEAKAPNMRECMLSHGWALDRIIPDPPTAHTRNSADCSSPPPVDNSSNDDWVLRQQEQDNLQQMLNTQQMINNQQMLNDQMFQQQQQQRINDMNR
jgi:hypothetical protein